MQSCTRALPQNTSEGSYRSAEKTVFLFSGRFGLGAWPVSRGRNPVVGLRELLR